MNVIKEINAINQRELENGSVNTPASWHTKYAQSAWVYIGNLPTNLTEGDILSIMSQYGEIEDINLVRDEKSGASKGFCFVKYEDSRSCILAVDNFNGSKVLQRSMRLDHVENYRLPKHLREKEEEMEKMVDENGALKAGHVYEGKELENKFDISKGHDLFASVEEERYNDELDQRRKDKEARKKERDLKRKEKAERKERKEEKRRMKRARKSEKENKSSKKSKAEKKKRSGRRYDSDDDSESEAEKKKRSGRRYDSDDDGESEAEKKKRSGRRYDSDDDSDSEAEKKKRSGRRYDSDDDSESKAEKKKRSGRRYDSDDDSDSEKSFKHSRKRHDSDNEESFKHSRRRHDSDDESAT